MTRIQRLRRVGARAALVGAIVHVFPCGNASVAVADVATAHGEAARCPDSDAVWSTVITLVPSEADHLLAAEPRVEIVDLGERYRVRIATDGGPLERMYTDPARDCEKRTRFAAEFIVVSLLPPQLGLQPDTASAASRLREGSGVPASDSRGASPQRPDVAPPLRSVLAPKRAAEGSAWQKQPSVLRIELSAIAEASPPFRSPRLLALGGGLRVRLGGGRLAGIAGIGYLPKAEFGVGDFTGAVTRIPLLAGMRGRVLTRRYLLLDADLAIAAAFERYEGVSPRVPTDEARVTPGVEAGVVASSHALLGLAPIVSLRCAWFPLTQELATAPEGNLGNTPSFWIGAELGMSLEL